MSHRWPSVRLRSRPWRTREACSTRVAVDEAVRLLQQLIDADQRNVGARCLLARAYLGSGDHRRAFRTADAAAGVAPDDASAHRLRALAALGIPKRRPEALRSAERAVELATDDVETLWTLGTVQLELGAIWPPSR